MRSAPLSKLSASPILPAGVHDVTNLRVSEIFLWAAASLVLIVLVISTWLFLNDEDRFGPEGVGNSFAISAIPDSVTVADITGKIDDLAQQLHINVYKSWPSERDGVRVTDYYLFEGDAATAFGHGNAGHFPSFGGMYVGRLAPSYKLTLTQLYGSYAVYGSEPQTARFAESLARLGIETSTTSVPSVVIRWPLEVAGGPIGAAIVIAWLALLLSSLNILVVRMAIAATRLSSGMSRFYVLIRDALVTCIPAATVGVLPTLIIVAYAEIHSGGYRVSSALSMLLPQLLVTLAAPGIALLLHRANSRRLSIGSVISGARSTTVLTSIAVLTVAFSGLSAAVAAVGVVNQTDGYRAERALDTYWAGRSNLSLISLSYAFTTADSSTFQQKLATIYRESERDDEVLLSQGDAPSSLGDAFDAGGQSRSAVANTAFLRTLGVLTDKQLTDIEMHVEKPGGAVILLPSKLSAQSSEITQQTAEWFNFEATLDTSDDAPEADISVIEDVNLGIVPRFDTALSGGGPLYLDDPILVVTDAGSELLSDDFYAGAGAYLEPDSVQTALDRSGAARYVTNLERIGDVAALKEANDAADLWAAIVGLILMCTVLIAGWIVVSSIYLSRERSRIFLMWTTGSSFAAIHGKFLAFACAAALLPSLGYIVPADIEVIPKFALLATQGTFAMCAICTALVLLGRQHHRAALYDS